MQSLSKVLTFWGQPTDPERWLYCEYRVARAYGKYRELTVANA